MITVFYIFCYIIILLIYHRIVECVCASSLFKAAMARFCSSLPKDQDCHEMWCKQKRRKEREAQQQAARRQKSEVAAETSVEHPVAAAAPPPESRGVPSAAPPTRQVSKDKSPIVNNKSHPGSLSVPLPTAPALNTSILESLSGNASSANRQPNLSSTTNLLMKNTHLDELTQITAQLQQLQSNEQSNKEIQQAIYKAKQKQLAILSQLTVSQQAKIAQTLSMAIASQSDQKAVQDTLQQFLTLIKPDVAATTNPVIPPPNPGPVDSQESSSSPVMAALPRHSYDYDSQTPKSALANMQTFDYGNQSNKEFERVAVEQLEWEEHRGGPHHPVQSSSSVDYPPRRQQEDRYGHEGWHS